MESKISLNPQIYVNETRNDKNKLENKINKNKESDFVDIKEKDKNITIDINQLDNYVNGSPPSGNVNVMIESPSTIILRNNLGMTNEEYYKINEYITRPFGKESIDHIQLRDISVLFHSAERFPEMMRHFIYELNRRNVNFFKEDVMSENIKIFISSKEQVYVNHLKFIELVESNFIDLAIKILFRYQDILTDQQFIAAWEVLEKYQESQSNNPYVKKKHQRMNIWK